jgi:AcrR family transcriptional regulator
LCNVSEVRFADGSPVVGTLDPVEPQGESTSERILEGARRCVRRGGPEHVTISAVAQEAGVSRPTLYRWFPTRELLLGAIAGYEIERFDRGLQQLADKYSASAARFDAALRYIVTYLDERGGMETVLASDTGFALQSMADSHPSHVASIARTLGDALEEIPAVGTGALTREQGAEMMLRIAYSQYVVPSGRSEDLIATFRSLMGLPPRRGRRQTRSAAKERKSRTAPAGAPLSPEL